MKKEKAVFDGFSKETFLYLNNLRENNNKKWFEENRKDYEKHLLEPFKLLVAELSGYMLSIDDNIETKPAVNKTISRIFRDVRFSKNKTPYRANMWIVFKHKNFSDWKFYPSYFFEVFPEWYRYGMGFYSATKEFMDTFRDKIKDQPKKFSEIVSPIENGGIFELKGEDYKRIKDNDIPQDLIKWHNKKGFYLTCEKKVKNNSIRKSIVDEITKGFEQIKPLYKFLWKIVYELQN